MAIDSIIVVYDSNNIFTNIYYLLLIAMESRLYIYLRFRKDVKFTSCLTKHDNVCKTIYLTMPPNLKTITITIEVAIKQ